MLSDASWLALPTLVPMAGASIWDDSPFASIALLVLGCVVRKRRVLALGRLARRLGTHLTPKQRKVRYRFVCGQFAAAALVLAWMLPFAITTAAFWCFYLLALVVATVLLEMTRQDMFDAGNGLRPQS